MIFASATLATLLLSAPSLVDEAAQTTTSEETTAPISEEPAPAPAQTSGAAQTTTSTAEERAAEELEALIAAMEADQAEASSTAGESGQQPQRPALAAIVSAINPEIGLTLDVSAAWFSDTPMQLGAHDPMRTGFTFNQLELSFAANVDPYFLFRANLVLSQFGVEVEEAYAQTTSLPGRIQIKAGQFLNRFGRLNPTHPHAWSFLDQPLVNGKFLGGEGNRGVGAELSWLAPTPFYLELVGSVMHPEGDCCARSFDGGEHGEVRSFGDFLYLLSAKSLFAFGPSWSLSWGLNALLGPNMTGHGNRTEIYGTDLYLRFKPVRSTSYSAFSLQAELMHRRRQVPDDLLVDNGFYAQAVWNISRRWETGVRYEWVGGLDADTLDPEWIGARQRLSLQGTLYPSHFSRVRLQANYDAPAWRDDPIWALMLGLEFNVGAHGAHNF